MSLAAALALACGGPTTKGEKGEKDMHRPIHFEILCDNPEKASAFYRDVLGWDIANWQGQTYWLATTGPEGTPGINGGIMHKHLPQSVINTVDVASIDETLGKIERAGGRKVLGPNQIPGVGLHAYCADPEGNLFGILQPEPPAGTDRKF